MQTAAKKHKSMHGKLAKVSDVYSRDKRKENFFDVSKGVIMKVFSACFQKIFYMQLYHENWPCLYFPKKSEKLSGIRKMGLSRAFGMVNTVWEEKSYLKVQKWNYFRIGSGQCELPHVTKKVGGLPA